MNSKPSPNCSQIGSIPTTPTGKKLAMGMGCGESNDLCNFRCSELNRQPGVTRRTEPENDAFCRHRWVRVFGIAFCARCGMCPVRKEMSSKA